MMEAQQSKEEDRIVSMRPARERTEIENPMRQFPVSVEAHNFVRGDDLQLRGTLSGPDFSIDPENSAAVSVEKNVQQSRHSMQIGITEVQKQMSALGDRLESMMYDDAG